MQQRSVEPERSGTPALRAQGMQKRYGATHALSSADLSVRSGEIHALLGENGAGKSTLVRLLSGVEKPDAGTIEILGGEPLEQLSVDLATSLGIGVIHQQHSLVPDLSIAENVALVAGYQRRGGVISWSRTHEVAAQALAALGVDADPGALVRTLSTSLQAIVSIARALALQTPILILDEPTASLESEDVEKVFDVIQRLRERGVAIILITHRLDEVLRFADRVTILRDGFIVHSGNVSDSTLDGLISHILGDQQTHDPRSQTIRVSQREIEPSNQAVLELSGVDAVGLRGIDLAVRPGEIMGCSGLLGSGHDQIAKVVLGISRHSSGQLRLRGSNFVPRSPAHAIACGIRYVPGDRVSDGIFEGLSAFENLFPNPPGRWYTTRSRSAEVHSAAERFDAFDVRPRDPHYKIESLSGGNAQKVMVARALEDRPTLLVLEDPTAGVDIGSRAQIHEFIRSACLSGCAVLLVSADMEEIVELSDAVSVLVDGTIRDVLRGDDITLTKILETANAEVLDRA